jgi:chemotaxis protein methyltransferase CheR
MLLHRHLPAYDGWEIEIVATDLSTRALQRAQEGRYGIDSAEHIPEAYRKTFMLKGVRSRARWMTVGPLARSGVRFSRLNLWTDPYPATAFDLILCRNVLIYFDVAAREEVLSRLVRRLAPDGLLLLGHAEALTGRKHGLHGVGPLTYAPARERVS